jgi:hypothetical protein
MLAGLYKWQYKIHHMKSSQSQFDSCKESTAKPCPRDRADVSVAGSKGGPDPKFVSFCSNDRTWIISDQTYLH